MQASSLDRTRGLSSAAEGEARGEPSSALIDALRRRIARLATCPQSLAQSPAQNRAEARPVRLGAPALDRALGEAGLLPGALHEVLPAAPGEAGAALGFVLALIACLLEHAAPRAPALLWAYPILAGLEEGVPHGRGLRTLGLDPAQLLLVRARRDREVLWALEEGLKSGALGAVLGELHRADLTATRRLALAAATSGTPAFLIRHGPRPGGSAAQTVWSLAALPSARHALDPKAPGSARWRVELIRIRTGRPGAWDVEFDHATRRFSVVSGLADRAAPARDPGEARQRRAG